MATYRVCFDGKWQGTFERDIDAINWAIDVSETGRLVHVARFSALRRPELIAILPEDQWEQGWQAWDARRVQDWTGGGW